MGVIVMPLRKYGSDSAQPHIHVAEIVKEDGKKKVKIIGAKCTVQLAERFQRAKALLSLKNHDFERLVKVKLSIDGKLKNVHVPLNKLLEALKQGTHDLAHFEQIVDKFKGNEKGLRKWLNRQIEAKTRTTKGKKHVTREQSVLMNEAPLGRQRTATLLDGLAQRRLTSADLTQAFSDTRKELDEQLKGIRPTSPNRDSDYDTKSDSSANS